MTKEEAVVFMDNLITCVNEHPIIADWLVEIENRKTEPQLTEKCLNCMNRYSYKCTKCDGEMYFKTEPQTESSTNEEKVQLTDCAWQEGAE